MANILVVSNNPQATAAAGGLLMEAGHRCFAASSVKQALAILDKASPDMAFVYHFPPESDGKIILEMLKKKERTLPVVFLAGSDDADTAILAAKAGAEDCISKTELKKKLLLTANSILKISGLLRENNGLREFISKNFIPARQSGPVSLLEAGKQAASEAEKRYIIKTLVECDWNKSKAAKALRIDYKTLFNKLKEYGLNIIEKQ